MVATAASSRPRFRTDLVAEPIDEEGQRFIDVIDPDTGNAFRFYEVEYSIACAMDGERDLMGLATWAREELGISPSPDELVTVISTLGDLGYLEGAGATTSAPMFGEDLVQKGVVVPPAGPAARAPDIELGAGGLTAGWNVPSPAAHAAQHGVEDVELGRAGSRATATGPAIDAMEDVGLGAAGAHASRQAEESFAGVGEQGQVLEFEAPTPPPVEPGAPILPALRPQTVPRAEQNYEDGPTNLPQPHAGDFDDDEVSVDLSEHLAIRPDDVKEAVRASQVMKAVDVPPELLAQLDDREQQLAHAAQAAKAAARDAQAAATPPPVRNTPVVPMMAQPDPSAIAARPPVELPREAVAVGKSKPIPATKAAADAAARAADAANAAKSPVVMPEKKGTSTFLIVLLVLVILGAGGFAVWKYVLNKDAGTGATDDSSSQKTSDQGSGAGPASAGSAAVGSAGSGAGTASAGSGAGPASAGSAAVGSAGSGAGTAGSGAGTATAPSAPSGVLHGSAGGSAELKATQAGVLAVVAAPGTKVAAGDVVARLGASPRTEAKIAEIDYDLQKRYPAEIKRNTELAAQARTQGNEALAKQLDAKIAERQKRITDRTAERAKYAGELDKLEMKATAAGTVKKAAAKGAQITAGEVVVTIDQGGGLTADLEIPGATYKPGDAVKVASKKAPDQVVECQVAAASGSKVTVACPADSGWADGTEIVLAK